MTQLTENELVKTELAKIECVHFYRVQSCSAALASKPWTSPFFLICSVLRPGNEVFKLIGPVLVKQEPDEAKANVQKRIDYLQAELCVAFSWF